MSNQTKTERKSDRELIVSRDINGPLQRVFEAWTKAELFQKWWVPKAMPIKLVSCELNVRTGGSYRLVFSAGDQNPEFFGKYLEVTPNSKIVWTNEESGEDAASITTVTFKEVNGTTSLTVIDLYPSKAALDEAISSGSTDGWPDQFEQLEQLIAKQRAD